MEQDFSTLATTDYGNVLGRDQFIDISIHPLFQDMKPISGPAYTVQLSSGDHLMLHSAIYEAPEGSIVVVDGVDSKNAVAGGNVCAIAKKRGIKGFVIDGVIRDLGEITAMGFPVYAKGVFPVPGKKQQYFELDKPITCGGVKVCPGDIIVADIEGIVVIPKYKALATYQAAKAKVKLESRMTLGDWEASHRLKVQQAIEAAKKAE
ncbi:Dimethylmenaquinone methyltransferase [Psychromonas ingrahamii 37]|uniref:Putative 4-hydroxy-4-methyl-2-oxoglutarate aldolase n=1 Tax=Psychromonas ingrahamii (strain DSM 17664 / CCUG 51855 / 37) TaxID=357804 RepID=A1SW35_PSYIN|nr:RraA family protein [Psychromonas ingrahamii]ABM03700.1 Dimethylmenaquinone methyltransferase [Psychromonas ingrahamii 37]